MTFSETKPIIGFFQTYQCFLNTKKDDDQGGNNNQGGKNDGMCERAENEKNQPNPTTEDTRYDSAAECKKACLAK